MVEDNWNVAAGASAIGALACVDSWLEDFRNDIAKNAVPTLIVHGDADRILPADATSRRQAKLLERVKLIELQLGHTESWTHSEEVNRALVEFLR